MTWVQWTLAGVGSAVILYLAGYIRFLTRSSNNVSNFAMMLLLDEFAYAKQRADFIRLIGAMETTRPATLYYAAMAELDIVAEKSGHRASAIAQRMARINSDIRSGARDAGGQEPSPPRIGDALPSLPSDGWKSEEEERRVAGVVAMTDFVLRARRGYDRFKRVLRNLLGIR